MIPTKLMSAKEAQAQSVEALKISEKERLFNTFTDKQRGVIVRIIAVIAEDIERAVKKGEQKVQLSIVDIREPSSIILDIVRVVTLELRDHGYEIDSTIHLMEPTFKISWES